MFDLEMSRRFLPFPQETEGASEAAMPMKMASGNDKID
jgi:hypothetical protein